MSFYVLFENVVVVVVVIVVDVVIECGLVLIWRVTNNSNTKSVHCPGLQQYFIRNKILHLAYISIANKVFHNDDSISISPFWAIV